jgi:xylulokinase
MLIGGLDIGTTGCKLTVFDGNGNQIHRSYREYPSSRESGAHEIDAGAVLEGALEVIKESASAVGEIAGIGITSFGETFVMTDEKGKPLHRAMLYTDPEGTRAVHGAVRKPRALKESAPFPGMKPHEMYSLSKIMWMKENCPEIYKKTKYIFLMEDFLVFHLTGMRRIDYSLATRTMGFDIRNLVWSREILRQRDRLSIMSKPVPTGSAAGNVSESAAAETDFRSGRRLSCISHDQIAAAVGAGVFDSDTAV